MHTNEIIQNGKISQQQRYLSVQHINRSLKQFRMSAMDEEDVIDSADAEGWSNDQ